jgi:hypothetical protein
MDHQNNRRPHPLPTGSTGCGGSLSAEKAYFETT